MSKKRLGRWVIVLFLLAALPGMTAVMAQGQEPAGKQLPAVTGPAGPTVVEDYWEVEPNNTLGQAQTIELQDVVAATFNPRNTDVDYFKFQVDMVGTGILIDTDSVYDGNTADTVVTLYNSNGDQIGYNDDAGNLDSLVFNVSVAGWYYVKVTNYSNNQCAPGQCVYKLMVTSPVLISANAANLGTVSVEGITFEARDILAFSYLGDDQHKWNMFLDATDVGFTKQLVNLSTGWSCNEPMLVVGFAANQTVVDWQGVTRTVRPWDWLIIKFGEVGPDSALTYKEVRSGANHGLTTSGEKPDAIAVRNRNCDSPANWVADVYFSTTGAGAVPKAGGGILKLADEDIFVSQNRGTDPGWYNYAVFDGSTVAGMAAEDVIAADSCATNAVCVTIAGTGTIDGFAVTQKDIFKLTYDSGGWDWSGWWHGPDYNWNFNIDAFDWMGH